MRRRGLNAGHQGKWLAGAGPFSGRRASVLSLACWVGPGAEPAAGGGGGFLDGEGGLVVGDGGQAGGVPGCQVAAALDDVVDEWLFCQGQGEQAILECSLGNTSMSSFILKAGVKGFEIA